MGHLYHRAYYEEIIDLLMALSFLFFCPTLGEDLHTKNGSFLSISSIQRMGKFTLRTIQLGPPSVIPTARRKSYYFIGPPSNE